MSGGSSENVLASPRNRPKGRPWKESGDQEKTPSERPPSSPKAIHSGGTPRTSAILATVDIFISRTSISICATAGCEMPNLSASWGCVMPRCNLAVRMRLPGVFLSTMRRSPVQHIIAPPLLHPTGAEVREEGRGEAKQSRCGSADRRCPAVPPPPCRVAREGT